MNNETEIAYRLRVRNKTDTEDLLVATSLEDDSDNPYISEPPTGDGQSLDPITAEATTGTYTVRLIDALLPDGSRFVTRVLSDERARQQTLSLRAYVDISTDGGGSWTVLVPGYVNANRKTSAIEYEIEVGDTRRKEISKTMFARAVAPFDNVTTVMGGPVLQDWGGLLENNGGWTFEVDSKLSSPGVVKLTLVSGFDPRKSPDTPFGSMSTAIRNYTVDFARGFFQPNQTYTVHDIAGTFPELRFKFVPVAGGDAIYLEPLSLPVPPSGDWWNPPGGVGDAITSGGESEIYVPKTGTNDAGEVVAFDPAVGTEYFVWLYALPVSEQNPLHIFERPVELWEKMRIAAGYVAGVDYDDTNLADLTAEINARFGGDVFLMLRLTAGEKFSEIERRAIRGPFRLSTRVKDGKIQLYSFWIRGTEPPVDVIDMDDLAMEEGEEEPEGTIFEIEERSIITAITLKQLRLFKWSSEETKQPDADAIVARPWPVASLENSADDIPPGLADSGHEVTLGDIPGTIVYDDGEPVPFEQYLRLLGDEEFAIFGRGAAEGELSCLPNVDKEIGEQVLVNAEHRPNAVVTQTPTSDNGGPRRCLVITRTERAGGPMLRVVDVAQESDDGGGGGTGVGGGTDDEEDVTAATPPVPVLFQSAPGTARANWLDSYPQFITKIQFEAAPPDDPTNFTLLYSGEHIVNAGIFQDAQAGIGLGWIVRARTQLTDGISSTAWSAYSNELEITTDSPPAPTEFPYALEIESTVADTSEAAWLNDDGGTNKVRIIWQGSVELEDPSVWNNIAGGTKLLAPGTTSDTQATGAANFIRYKLCYVNPTTGAQGPTVTSPEIANAT